MAERAPEILGETISKTIRVRRFVHACLRSLFVRNTCAVRTNCLWHLGGPIGNLASGSVAFATPSVRDFRFLQFQNGGLCVF